MPRRDLGLMKDVGGARTSKVEFLEIAAIPRSIQRILERVQIIRRSLEHTVREPSWKFERRTL